MGMRNPAALRQCVNRRKQPGKLGICEHIHFLWLGIAKVPVREDIGFLATEVHVLRKQADGACPALDSLCIVIIFQYPRHNQTFRKFITLWIGI